MFDLFSAKLPCKLVVFEGINGCGKTTQLQLAHKYFEDKGLRVGCFYDPGICDSCDKSVKDLRQLACRREWSSIYTRFLMFIAAREELNCYLDEVADDYDIILLDRYVPSTLAYQTLDFFDNPGNALLTDNSELFKFLISSTGNFQPDLFLFFDAAPDVAYSRTGKSTRSIEEGIDIFEQKAIKFLADLREVYSLVMGRLLKITPDSDVVLVPASTSIETTFSHYKEDLDKLINGLSTTKN